MAKQRKEKRHHQWQRESDTLARHRRTAPYYKRLFALRGINLPFYDFLDSFEDEFNRIASWGKNRFPSLLDVIEVEEAQYLDGDFTKRLYSQFQQVRFDFGDCKDYLNCKNEASSFEGFANAFLDELGELRTLVVIRKDVPSPFVHRDYLYINKIAALCHELGHVDDMENGENFDFESGRVKIIQAEVYANLFGLELMSSRALKQSFDSFASGIEMSVGIEGYLGLVAAEVASQMPTYPHADWQDFLGSFSNEELASLGPDAIRAFQNK